MTKGSVINFSVVTCLITKMAKKIKNLTAKEKGLFDTSNRIRKTVCLTDLPEIQPSKGND